MTQVVFIIIAVWFALLACVPLLGVTWGLTLALLVAGLAGWIAARIVPDQLRRYQPATRDDISSHQGASASAELAPRRSLRMAARATVANLALLLASFLLGLLLCELTLRYVHPKYQGVAEAQYERDPILLWWHNKNSRGWYKHPDTGSYHPYHHNNLRMRQHRDFSETDIDSAINIGFFGDSFLENPWVASQYILTEPLDYLLNLSHNPFNTMNFGVKGYGTGQHFLRYENFRYAEKLDYILYVFTDNDLRNIYENGLFHLDEAGELARSEAIRSSWWNRIVSRLHISYLLLDVGKRFPFVIQEMITNLEENLLRSNALQDLRDKRREKHVSPIAMDIERDFFEGRLNNERVDKTTAIFRQLIHRWRLIAEEKGSKFYIVLLPRQNEARLTTILGDDLGDDFTVINMYECFSDYVRDYQQVHWFSSPYRFKNDSHWNEAGNQLAVVCLYRFLEQELGLPALSDDALREALFTYYSSFDGWIPDERWIKEVPVPSHVRDSIRDKYLALEKGRPGTD